MLRMNISGKKGKEGSRMGQLKKLGCEEIFRKSSAGPTWSPQVGVALQLC